MISQRVPMYAIKAIKNTPNNKLPEDLLPWKYMNANKDTGGVNNTPDDKLAPDGNVVLRVERGKEAKCQTSIIMGWILRHVPGCARE